MTTAANIIVSQIGRTSFAMMGAKNIVAAGDVLSFDIGANARKISHVSITLDPSDTYTVRVYKGARETTKLDMKTGEFVTRGGRKLAGEFSDVYADALHSTIESATGLYLRF